MTLSRAKEVTAPQSTRAGWLVAGVGSCIGLSIMGDSLLYNILPLAAPSLGISLPAVGLLLSVNRLVRLLTNSLASRVFERLGPRLPFIAAALIGLLATAGYGLAGGLIAFVVMRLLWGLAWSGLRQGGYQAVWAGRAEQKGRLTGLLWGLVRLGSAISVVLGGVLFDRYGYSTAIWMAIIAAILSIPVSAIVRWPQNEKAIRHEADKKLERSEEDGSETGWLAVLSMPPQRWLLITGFFEYLLSGVVVSTTALFVAERVGVGENAVLVGIGVATLTGIMHGVRWITDLGLGPLVGAISDRYGQSITAVAVVAILFLAMCLALLSSPLISLISFFVVLICDGALHIVMSAAASGVALESPRPHTFIGIFTTTTDAGSALGPLVAYSLVTGVGLTPVYLILTLLLVGGILQYKGSEGSVAVG